MIDRFHSLRHFGSHIDPVWAALPLEVKGAEFTRDRPPPIKRDLSRPFLVASFADAQAVAPNPYVLADHGSGQSYTGVRNGSYSGGDGHERCILFLCPSERVAMRWMVRYDVPVRAIGCPRLDRYSGSSTEERCRTRGPSTDAERPRNGCLPAPAEVASPRLGPPVVAISYHWDAAVCPETRSAWRHYDPHLPRLCADPRFRVVGHSHPRLWPTISRRWEELGVTPWPDVDQVLSEADVVVMDNSSLGYEAAALGIPVVCLNIPSYRREVEHGGRFWDSPPGIQCDHPADLADTIVKALDDTPSHRAIRARAVAYAYSAVDGHASERAAAAIMEVLNG